ncbi:MAG: CvpA family protein [Vicingaceae bacterium]|nr:CvpA family protein [Vicingaceae bacterium]
MNYLDIIIVIPLIWGAYKGFRKGFVIEIASLVGLVLGVWGGINFSSYSAEYLGKAFNISPEIMPLLSFVVTFIAIVILVFFIAKMLERVVKMVALGIVNRIAGMVFGMMKFGIIISIILNLVNTIDNEVSFIENEVKSKSLLYQPFSDFSGKLFPKLNEIKEQTATWKDDVMNEMME